MLKIEIPTTSNVLLWSVQEILSWSATIPVYTDIGEFRVIPEKLFTSILRQIGQEKCIQLKEHLAKRVKFNDGDYHDLYSAWASQMYRSVQKNKFGWIKFSHKRRFREKPISWKTDFVKNRFREKPISWKTDFVKNRFHRMDLRTGQFHSKWLNFGQLSLPRWWFHSFFF